MLSLAVTHCCHLLHYSLSLVVPLDVARCHSLSLVVTRCTIVCLFIKDLSEVWKNINNFIPLLIRKGSTNRWSQTASIIKSLMPFSFIFTMPNSFKNELYSEKVLINNFSFLILFIISKVLSHFRSETFSDSLYRTAYAMWIFLFHSIY